MTLVSCLTGSNFVLVDWTIEETKWLLDQYYLYIDEVGPMKIFQTKKVMWQFLARKMANKFDSTKSGVDLANRVGAVIKQKKATICGNHVSGAVRGNVEYEEELDKIAAADDSIEPEVMRGVKSVY